MNLNSKVLLLFPNFQGECNKIMIIIITQIGFPPSSTFCLITNIILRSDFNEDILKIIIKTDFLYYNIIYSMTLCILEKNISVL